MSNSLGHLQSNQLKLEQIKRKRKSYKGVMPIRKSARLNKTSTPFVVKIDFLDDDSYHGDSKDNDGLRKIAIGEIDDESYQGVLEDTDNLEEGIIEDLVQPFENKSQLFLYHFIKANNMNLIGNKLRLI